MLFDDLSEVKEIRRCVAMAYGSETIGDDVSVVVVSVVTASDHLRLARGFRVDHDSVERLRWDRWFPGEGREQGESDG